MTQIQNDIVADIKRVCSEQGKVTRFIYRTHGIHSCRQIDKHFGNFSTAVSNTIDVPQGDSLRGKLQDREKNSESLKETVEVAGDKMHVTLPKTRIHTKEQLIEHFQVDTKIWDVERFACNTWEMAAIPRAVGESKNWKRPSTTPILTTLYQVKATFVRNKDKQAIFDLVDDLKAELKALAPTPKLTTYGTLDSDNILELMLPDLHAGKLAWSKETGYQDYDLPTSIETYQRAIDSLLEQASGYKFDKIILCVGNDLLQTDTIQGTTYSGTKVDTDSRYHKVYKTVRKMLCETIEKLRLIAPVEVKVVPGNHDTLSTFTMGDSLECRFYNYPDVVVDNSPEHHKVVEWGDCFLIMTHGHKGKQDDYGIWMAAKYPAIFGRTKFREVHCGHRHKTAMDEKFGIRIRTLSALCPPDAWHAHGNMIGNLRTAEAFVWNKKRGLVAMFFHNEID